MKQEPKLFVTIAEALVSSERHRPEGADMKRRLPAWLLVAGLGAGLCLLLSVAAGGSLAARQRQRAASLPSQQQIEQRAVQFVQNTWPGAIAQVSAQRTTLGQLFGTPNCLLADKMLRAALVFTGIDTYNVCDPQTPLWQVSVQGAFSIATPTGLTSWQSIEVVFDETGYFLRAGPLP
jgi:hypothetical protein